MLNSREQQLLEQVERQLRSQDPAFVTRLGDGQQRLPRTPSRTRSWAPRPFRLSRPVVGLLVLAVGLLVLGLVGPALLVAALGAALGWLGAVHAESDGRAEPDGRGRPEDRREPTETEKDKR